MPSVTPFQPPTLSPSKKRRRDDDHSEVHVPLYGSPKPSLWSWSANRDAGSRITQYESEPQNHLCAINNNERLIFPSSTSGRGGGGAPLLNMPRKMIPVPVSKRFRVYNENEEHHHHHQQHSHHHHSHQQQPLLQQSHFFHGHPEYSTPPASPLSFRTSTIIPKSINPAALLSPCHICHRKPTKRSDLDSFADCLGCGQRACFVCIRACQGWLPPTFPSELEEEQQSLSSSFTMKDADDDPSLDQEPHEKLGRGGGGGYFGGWSGRGHRAMICSRCCVERGTEGDVVCLGCLAWMEGT
ncbi:hypothetical protein F4820DRAFT_409644 [Hypoxylon rubiginosum]|uniref:Uncharacterized protein n=1 Tax=Hypoxylon rubiginosum TaxID=110542 RepID=A0ACB9ZBI4_9PEZI|nr:hypothetical protein F4820DRAFT_409644 [Hypoxylon rubiginosum]